MKDRIITLFLFVALLAYSNKSSAHCEVPCGIYGDSIRFALIDEHIETIEKSMKQIIELSSAEDVNYNQLVRWVNNKEEHAEKIQEIVSQYFLHQRVKIASPDDSEAYNIYTKQLVLLHKLSVYAMKAKQTTDLQYVELLHEALDEFSGMYFHKH